MAPIQHLTTLFALLLSSTTLVAAKCHSSGSFGKYPEGFVETACHSLSGHYIAGELKRDCAMYTYDAADGTTAFWNFKITMNGGGGDLEFEECKKRLGDEAIGCNQGGVSDIGDWTFSSDPGMYEGYEINPESCANMKLHEMGS